LESFTLHAYVPCKICFRIGLLFSSGQRHLVSVVLKWIGVDVRDCNVITEPYALFLEDD
jgi:hypothetical protein